MKNVLPLTALLCGMLSGCATHFDVTPQDVGVPYKIEGFPVLEKKVIYVDDAGIQKHCDAHVERKGAKALACAQINFVKKTCTIYIKENASYRTVRHEHWHCEGWAHEEGDAFHQSFLMWQPILQKHWDKK